MLNKPNSCHKLNLPEILVTNPISQCFEYQYILQSVIHETGKPCAKYDDSLPITETAGKACYWILCFHDELTEVLEWLEVLHLEQNVIEAQYEVVDALHFINNFAIEFGIDPCVISNLPQCKEAMTLTKDFNIDADFTAYLNAIRYSVAKLMSTIPWKSWKTYTDITEKQNFQNNSDFLDHLGAVYLGLFKLNSVLGADPVLSTRIYAAKHYENIDRQKRNY